MSANQPLIRNIELLVGPLAEDQGGGPTSQALRLFSDGSRTGLRISFNVKKTLMSTPNVSSISIYNLRPATRERIRATLSRVRLSVGYENTGINVLSQGGILSSVTEKKPPEYATTLQILDGFGGQVKGISNVTFDGRIQVAEIVRTIAADMPGVEVGRIDIDGSVGSGGLSITDRTADALDALAMQFGFSWSIQDGVFQAISDRRSFNRTLTVSFRNRTLIQATPLLAGPMQIENGVEIVAILNPRVGPGDRVQLESEVNPGLNGVYKIHELDATGDTYDQSWTMTIRSYRIL